MKISNRFILDQLYFGDPKVTPLSCSWLEYTAKVHEIITDEFRKEIGANPVKGSSLDLRIGKASKNFATIARRLFKTKGRNYNRSTAQHFFKIKTHIPLREKKARRDEGPDPAGLPGLFLGHPLAGILADVDGKHCFQNLAMHDPRSRRQAGLPTFAMQDRF